MKMFTRKTLSLAGALVALGIGAATLAQAQGTNCPPGTTNPAYCANNSNPSDPPPATPPAVQPPAEGQAPEVAGTLTGGTRTIEVPSSSNEPGTANVQINVAGNGTLIIKAGDQTITVTVAPDGTTTIDPGNGEEPIVVGGAGGAPGTVEITITPDGVTYDLKAPGEKTVQIGNATATFPGTASITKEGNKTTYRVRGNGDCEADLDPNEANSFNAGDNVACVITSGTSTQSRANINSFGKTRASDVIKTGNKRDRIQSGPGKDYVHANGGADYIRGGSNDDSLYGDGGNDRIFGDGSDDHLYGGAGNDQLRGGDGRDFVDGGPGNDVIRNTAQSLDTIKCGSGRDVVYAGPLDKVFSDCEVVHRG
jgi:Ca2+-binding RTX toxin-like protein